VYGARFDSLAATWQFIENEHDKEHPNRGQCGGVGGCSLMFVAVRLQDEMIDALKEWRPTPSPLSNAAAVQPPDLDRLEYDVARKALRAVLDAVDGWVDGAKENHRALEHRGEQLPCWESFHPDDIRNMVADAARVIGVTL
jgi:hypothetical protein